MGIYCNFLGLYGNFPVLYEHFPGLPSSWGGFPGSFETFRCFLTPSLTSIQKIYLFLWNSFQFRPMSEGKHINLHFLTPRPTPTLPATPNLHYFWKACQNSISSAQKAVFTLKNRKLTLNSLQTTYTWAKSAPLPPRGRLCPCIGSMRARVSICFECLLSTVTIGWLTVSWRSDFFENALSFFTISL